MPYSISLQTLKTKEIGRLTIYAPVINSTMTLVSNLNMRHGLAVIGRKQTAGVGRNKNQVIIRSMINIFSWLHVYKNSIFWTSPFIRCLQWLSPDGCALFSVQLHIPLSSPLGQKLPLLQHLVSIAIVQSITKLDEYKVNTEQATNQQKASLSKLTEKYLQYQLCVICVDIDQLICLFSETWHST